MRSLTPVSVFLFNPTQALYEKERFGATSLKSHCLSWTSVYIKTKQNKTKKHQKCPEYNIFLSHTYTRMGNITFYTVFLAESNLGLNLR